MGKGKKRYSLRVNGRSIKYYQTKRGAERGIGAMYDNGEVLPDDTVTIYDTLMLCYVL